MKKFIDILVCILGVLLIGNLSYFLYQVNRIHFLESWIPIVVNIGIILLITFTIYFIYRKCTHFMKKGIWITSIIVFVVLNIGIGFLNVSTDTIHRMFSKVTSREELYQSTFLVLKDSNIKTVTDLKGKTIGLSGSTTDIENYQLPYQALEEQKMIDKVEIYSYADYVLALKDLLSGKIDALGISANYIELYEEYFPDNELKDSFRTLSVLEKIVENNPTTPPVSEEKPFTVLVIGADTPSGNYNADVLILMTVNPTTKTVEMVDIVRDTYVYNSCNNEMDKITHTGWYGVDCTVNTVSTLFDLPIDYYIKLNFNALRDFVDMIGGVTIEVPYDFTVIRKDRSTYKVTSGLKTLNGLEALTLVRVRKEPGSSLLSRGEMQMKMIQALVKQVDSSFLLSHFFGITDLVGTNIKMNTNTQNLYYLVQKYASIKNSLQFHEHHLKGSVSTYYHSGINQNLENYIYDKSSLEELKNILKMNLQ